VVPAVLERGQVSFPILFTSESREYDGRSALSGPIFLQAFDFSYWGSNGHSGRFGEKQQGGQSFRRLRGLAGRRALIDYRSRL
jgi:hypothetical protein